MGFIGQLRLPVIPAFPGSTLALVLLIILTHPAKPQQRQRTVGSTEIILFDVLHLILP